MEQEAWGQLVHIRWVLSHLGVPGNEEADKLAEQADYRTPIVRNRPRRDHCCRQSGSD